MSQRISIELENEVAAELARLADASDAELEQYIASLLGHLVLGRQLDARDATELLRGMPGALDDARDGSGQARRGETKELDTI